MVRKVNKNEGNQAGGSAPYDSVKDSAQQIWQAGLGAFARAQAEGSKAFEALVQEGTKLQRKTQAVAEERIAEATSRVSHMATDIGSKASGHWDKLENIFEERVARALNKLGVPSAKDIAALITRIEDLNQTVQKLTAGAGRPATKAPVKPRRAPAKSPAARSTPAKTAGPAARRSAVKKSG